MSEPPAQVSSVRWLAADALACAGAATLIVACGAAAVTLAGLTDEARRSLQFDFAGVEPTPAAVLDIAVDNARLAAAVLLCAAVVPRLPQPARHLADLVLAALLVANASLVGLALGAYGAQALAAILVHLPAELAALSLAGGAYLSSRRRQPLPLAHLALVAALCVLLLGLAATLETYAPLGGLG